MNIMKQSIVFALLLSSLLFTLTGANPVSKENRKIEIGASPTVVNQGAQHVRTNVFPNNDFEQTDSSGVPTGLSSYASGYSYLITNNTESVISGSQSLKYELNGGQFGQTGTISRGYASNLLLLNQSVEISFKLNLTNPELSNGGSLYLLSQFRAENYSWYYIYDYLSTNNFGGSNSSTRKYLFHNQTLGTWNTYTFNASAYFEQAFGNTSQIYYDWLGIYLYSPSQPISSSILLLDDFRLTNRTGYNFEPDGDFEGSSNWSSQRTNYGTISTVQEGERTNVLLLNTTTTRETDSSYASVSRSFSSQSSRIAIRENASLLSFDYKVDNQSAGGDGFENYLRLSFTNGSNYALNLYYYLSRSYFPLSGNYSSPSNAYVYLNSSIVTSYGEWQSLSIDLYDLLNSLNYTNFGLTYLQFSTNSFDFDMSLITQIDNLKLISDVINDYDFESTFSDSSGSPLQNWAPSGSATYNRSSIAHSGNFGAQINLTSSQYLYLYKVSNTRIKDNYFMDFWWMVDNVVSTGQRFIQINLDFGAYDLIYYVGIPQNSLGYSNSSNAGTYLLGDFTQNLTWSNLRRNLASDLNAVFGENIWNLSALQIYMSNQETGDITFYLDDLDIIEDVGAPEVLSVDVLDTPVYYSPVRVQVDVTDTLGDTTNVSLVYRVDGAAWSIANLSSSGQTYTATIPAAPYNSLVEYYIHVEDEFGNSADSMDGSTYYKYTIGDDVAPLVSISDPANNTAVTGNISITVKSSDVGSSVESVELLVDGSSVGNSSSAPYTFVLDTRDLSNGIHTITATARDSSGNTATSLASTIVVDNDLDAPEISDILLFPTTPEKGVPTVVSVSVTDRSEITSVTLMYRMDGGQWQSIPMESLGDLYTAELPAIADGQTMEYYITATDEFGQTSTKGSESNPFVYSFDATVPPEGIDSVMSQAQEIYDNYTFFVGMAATVGLYLAFLLSKFIFRMKFGKKTEGSS